MAVKWGVLGTAGIARRCTIPGMKGANNCELYAIAGRDEKKVNDFKLAFGFQKAYVGYDRLYIHGSKGTIRSDVEYNQ